MTPEISVAMANYNGARHLYAALKSLETQTFRNWELIFVDDGSKDDSVALASRFAANDPRIRILAQRDNLGPAASRNKAIELARGRWLAIFDSDDLMRPDRLEILRERARSDRAALVADDLLVFSDHPSTARHFLPHEYVKAPRWIGLAEFIDSNRLYARTPDLGYLKPLISLEHLKAHGIRYDETLKIGEDYELVVQLMLKGVKLRLEPGAHYLYRKHPNSVSYRMHGDAIKALIEANERLSFCVSQTDETLNAAIRRRDRSLRAMLAYDRVICMLKTGDYVHAAQLGLKDPRIWPLLTGPLKARIRRLAARRPASEQVAAAT